MTAFIKGTEPRLEDCIGKPMNQIDKLKEEYQDKISSQTNFGGWWFDLENIDHNKLWSWIIQNFTPKEEIGLPPEGTGKKPKEEVKEIEKIEYPDLRWKSWWKDKEQLEDWVINVTDVVNKLNK